MEESPAIARKQNRPQETGGCTAGTLNVMARIRLDQMLVKRALVHSRSRGRDAIERGLVLVDGMIARKAGVMVGDDAVIELPDDVGHYVSRGALKLIAGLDHFAIDPDGLICLDVGASTGGFCQVLLERGAAKIYGVDVGRAQLHDSLQSQTRLVSLEGVDARALDRSIILEPVDLIVCDVSFISLAKALPVPLSLAAYGARLVALIKPQFEVGRAGLGKGGIVRDDAERLRAVNRIRDWLAADCGWRVVDVIPSPITGGAGNVEYLIGAVNERISKCQGQRMIGKIK